MNSVELVFFKLLAHDIELSIFEKWIYSEPELEKMLDAEDYLSLISINYKTPSGLYEAEKVLTSYFSIGKFHEWNIRRILNKIIEKPNNVHEYIEQCYDLYCDGFYFMDNLGLGYGLGLACPDEYNEEVDDYYPQIVIEVEKVLGWLASGKIEITGHSGEYQGIEYIDNRVPEEKETTGYKKQESNNKWWQFWL